jgi:hypothetical protein
MTREERKKFENLNSSYNKYWVPCVWFSNLAAQARREGLIRDNSALKLLLEVSLLGGHSYRIPVKLCPMEGDKSNLPRPSPRSIPGRPLVHRAPTPGVHSPPNTFPGSPSSRSLLPPPSR